MECVIKHSTPGRIRFQLAHALSEHDSDALEALISNVPHVEGVWIYPRIGSFSVSFEPTSSARLEVLEHIAHLDWKDVVSWQPQEAISALPRKRDLFAQIANSTFWFAARLIFLPRPIRAIWWLYQAIPFWKAAANSLKEKRLDVPVLDACAIALGFTQGTDNAGETIYLLQLSETLEDYTQKRAASSLAHSLLNIPTTARVVRGDEELEVDITSIERDERVVARLGQSIPVDGEVVQGEALVNQSTLTGEPLAVLRKQGDTVYAGTVVEEGELFIAVTGDPTKSKIRSILSMMQEGETVQSASHKKMLSLANRLVPWNFAVAGIVALITRSLTKTASVLMVDYSCALRMSSSIAVMAAQRDGSDTGLVVKGSRYFQAMDEADVIVFDKTGTLTAATPKVCHVEPLDGYSRDESLRLAACLEEHFPHPVARAVVAAAEEEGLEHRERHAEVEYVVAHGIASSLDGKRVVIGSQHFVLEDEKVPVPDDELKRIQNLLPGASILLLAVNNELRAAIYIDDPVREDASRVVSELRNEGFKRVIMLTGDEEGAARRIAEQAGITEYHFELLPEEKLEIVKRLQAEGCKVCMVGDGVNDSPALASANVSIAMGAGSAIAREAADITLTSNSLSSIVELKRLSRALEKRLRQGFRFTIGFNSMLLALGIAGILTPQRSALLHNGSTLALTLKNSRPFDIS